MTPDLWFLGCTANVLGKNGVYCLKILLNQIISHKTELHEDNCTNKIGFETFLYAEPQPFMTSCMILPDRYQ